MCSFMVRRNFFVRRRRFSIKICSEGSADATVEDIGAEVLDAGFNFPAFDFPRGFHERWLSLSKRVVGRSRRPATPDCGKKREATLKI